MEMRFKERLFWPITAVVLGWVSAMSASIHYMIPFAIFLVGVAVTTVYLYPAMAAFLIFAGLLTDTIGRASTSVAGIPITLSKMMLIITFIPFSLRVLTEEWRGFRWDNIVFAYLMCVVSMILSIGTSGRIDKGGIYVISSVMLMIMCLLVAKSLEGGHVKLMILGCAGLFALVMVNTVLRGGAVSGNALAQWGNRSAGAYGDANEWAAAMIVLAPVLVAGVYGLKSTFYKVMAFGLVGLVLLSIFQSFSRAGLLGFAVTVPFYLYLFRKDRGLLLAATVLFLVVAPIFVPIDALILRYRTLLDPQLEADLGLGSLNERKQLLQAGVHIFSTHPIMGVGTGMFPTYASYVTAGSIWKVAHNTYLTVMAEQGMPGIFTHLYLGFSIFRSMAVAFQRLASDYHRQLVLGCAAGMVGIAAVAMTLNLFQFNPIFFVMGIALYLIRVSELSTEEQAT